MRLQARIPADKTGVIEEGRFGEAAVKLGKGSVNVYISTIDSGRTSLKTMKSLGMFVHTLFLSMDLKQDMTSEGLVLKSNEVLRGRLHEDSGGFAEEHSRKFHQCS